MLNNITKNLLCLFILINSSCASKNNDTDVVLEQAITNSLSQLADISGWIRYSLTNITIEEKSTTTSVCEFYINDNNFKFISLLVYDGAYLSVDDTIKTYNNDIVNKYAMEGTFTTQSAINKITDDCGIIHKDLQGFDTLYTLYTEKELAWHIDDNSWTNLSPDNKYAIGKIQDNNLYWISVLSSYIVPNKYEVNYIADDGASIFTRQ